MIFCKERSEIMKLMTMNVHSLVEKDYERKLVEFADVGKAGYSGTSGG